MGIIIFNCKILEAELVDIPDCRIQPHYRERSGFSPELKPDLFKMIPVNMCIPESMDEFARHQPGDLRHHHEQQRIGSNIERNSQENICASLVKLTGKLVPGHIELEKYMTGWQSHVVQIGHIPCTDKVTP
jgi:hypothetical protein